MDHEGFAKAERRKLRELAGLASDRELGAELGQLEAAFAEWRAGRISPYELSTRIHAFHQGPARDLFVLYTRVHAETLVARAVAYDILREGEVPPEFLPRLARTIAYYRSDLAAPEADEGEDPSESTQ